MASLQVVRQEIRCDESQGRCQSVLDPLLDGCSVPCHQHRERKPRGKSLEEPQGGQHDPSQQRTLAPTTRCLDEHTFPPKVGPGQRSEDVLHRSRVPLPTSPARVVEAAGSADVPLSAGFALRLFHELSGVLDVLMEDPPTATGYRQNQGDGNVVQRLDLGYLAQETRPNQAQPKQHDRLADQQTAQ